MRSRRSGAYGADRSCFDPRTFTPSRCVRRIRGHVIELWEAPNEIKGGLSGTDVDKSIGQPRAAPDRPGCRAPLARRAVYGVQSASRPHVRRRIAGPRVYAPHEVQLLSGPTLLVTEVRARLPRERQ